MTTGGNRRSVRTYVVGLIVLILLPLLAFSAFLVIRSAEHEQDLMGAGVRDRNLTAMTAIEGNLSGWRSRLFVIAGGITDQPSDLAALQARAAQAFPEMTVVLTDLSGQEVINTAEPFGSDLPHSSDAESLRWVQATQRPYVSNFSTDPLTGRPAAWVSVPVVVNGKLLYVLEVDVLPQLPSILTGMALPPGWIATITDRNGVILARNVDPDRYVGKLARPNFITLLRHEQEGSFLGVSQEGVPLFNAFTHVPIGQWTVLIGIPQNLLYAPVHQSTGILILSGGLVLILAVALASQIGGRIATPVVQLVPLAEAVGMGETIAPPPMRLLEADAVARSLSIASHRLRQAAAGREAAVAALSDSEQRYRALAEDLARVNRERMALLLRTIAAQEDERARIARELHDGLAQYLTALRLRLDGLRQATPGAADHAKAVRDLLGLTGELGRAVNRMAWELRPVPLDELGLRAAVKHYLEEWGERSDILVDVAVNLPAGRLPPAVEFTVFRVLQEATTNVLKHAQADHVGVILEANDAEVRLIVEDDGRGVAESVVSPGLGLIGMRERLALVHGSLEVESAPGAGTTLFVRIPLRNGCVVAHPEQDDATTPQPNLAEQASGDPA
jgi:signal transduction histidine kinase